MKEDQNTENKRKKKSQCAFQNSKDGYKLLLSKCLASVLFSLLQCDKMTMLLPADGPAVVALGEVTA